MTTLDLHGIERKSWRVAQRDGLTDCLFGVIFLAAAVIGILDRTSVSSGARIAILVAIQFSGAAATIWLRKRHVAPRLGRVKYAPRRVRQARAVRVFLGACVAFTVFLVVLTALSDRLGFRIFGDVGKLGAWAIIAAVIIVPISGLALFLDYPRLMVYAGLLAGAEFLHIVINLPSRVPYANAYAYGVASLVAFAIGVPIFVRFLRETPRPEGKPDDT